MKVLGIIIASEQEDSLRELTAVRTRASIPFAGRYRLIDFTLSNMVNSGITNIGIVTKNNYNSLMDHIGSGKDWDLNRKRDGVFILPPFASLDNIGWFKGDVDALAGAMGYIKRATQEYVIISGSRFICNMAYKEALDFHMESGADITVITKEVDVETSILNGKSEMILETDVEGKVTDIAISKNIENPQVKISMEMYIIEKRLLESLVNEAMGHNRFDFERDILQRNLTRLKIYAYEFKGYTAIINCVKSYFKHSMELLKTEISDKLFLSETPIYTKVKDEVPCLYGDGAQVVNSLVADGCIIEGQVENSVIFRGVRIGKGAKVKNCIIMQDSEIMENAVLDHVILDKKVMVHQGKVLMGVETYPVVLTKGSVV